MEIKGFSNSNLNILLKIIKDVFIKIAKKKLIIDYVMSNQPIKLLVHKDKMSNTKYYGIFFYIFGQNMSSIVSRCMTSSTFFIIPTLIFLQNRSGRFE